MFDKSLGARGELTNYRTFVRSAAVLAVALAATLGAALVAPSSTTWTLQARLGELDFVRFAAPRDLTLREPVFSSEPPTQAPVGIDIVDTQKQQEM